MYNMKHLFISAVLAAKLKVAGFNETCIAISNGDKEFYGEFHNKHEYYKERGLILLQQALDWFRDKHKLHIEVERDLDGWCYKITEFSSGNKFKRSGNLEMPDHNKELEKAIEKAFELIKVV